MQQKENENNCTQQNCNKCSKPEQKAKGQNEAEKQKSDGIDIKKMTKEELCALAQALIDENTEMEKQLNGIKEEKQKLEKTAAKAAELSSMYSALLKDFENYRKRNADIEASSKDNAVAETGLKIVPVFDNLKIAENAVSDKKSKEGITLIIKQFEQVLNNLGIEQIISEGELFDPLLHNALMAEDTDDENLKGRIKQVFSDGYKYKDKIIKQSQVIVYK